MADIPGPSNLLVLQENVENKENMDLEFEPEKKKAKIDIPSTEIEQRLEDRLCGILCCAVCLDLPRICFQCINGHLMCAGCFNHLLADGRLKDETSTCPNCRCEISKSSCTRNLAVEKAVSELPSTCQFCACMLPRNVLSHHERELCQERLSTCKYARIGCPWKGPNHELREHEAGCQHPHKSGDDIMDAVACIDQRSKDETQLYSRIFSLLSCEKITFNDLQLKPYRSDDFITKLFYETSRFSAFSHQWVIKARINNDQKNPALTSSRSMSYQLVLKGKASQPVNVTYIALKGPYGEMRMNPVVYSQEFSNESPEAEYKDLPIYSSLECNKILASKTINMRLIMVLSTST